MTLALHGKSKTHQGWLIAIAVAVVAFATVAGGILGPAESARAASTLYVNDDQPANAAAGKNCNQPNYSTVQDAVAAAEAGDRIIVCEGTYIEQVTIDKSIELRGQGAAVIKAPATMVGIKAIVRVTGEGTSASIEKLTISGPGGGGCASLHFGIRVDGSAHADIIQNHITEIRGDSSCGAQNGQAIFVGRQSESTTGTAVIKQNLIDKYQKGGIVVDNLGSHAEISHNTIVGVGPTAAIAQNGIQVSREATGNVHHNEVSGNLYTGAAWAASGILLYQSGAVTVSHNVVTTSGVGIFAVDAPSLAVVHNNVSDGEDGIDIVGTTTGAVVSHNRSSGNEFDGIYTDASGNTFSNNIMSANDGFDANDVSTGSETAGTDNTWSNNQCMTSSPEGLCK